MADLTNVSILDRITNTEAQLKQLIENFNKFSAGLQQNFKQYDERLHYLMKTNTALIQTVNSFAQFTTEEMRNQLFSQIETPNEEIINIIQHQIDKNILDENIALQAAQVAGVEKYLSEGKLSPIEKVTETSLIICHRLEPDGSYSNPGRIQMEFSAIYPEYKERLLNKGIGELVEDVDGSRMKIVEIYAINLAAFLPATNNNTSNSLPN